MFGEIVHPNYELGMNFSLRNTGTSDLFPVSPAFGGGKLLYSFYRKNDKGLTAAKNFSRWEPAIASGGM